MLVLHRRVGEKIQVGEHITIMVVELIGGGVRIGVDAPRDVAIHRWEVAEAIRTGKPVADIKKEMRG